MQARTCDTEYLILNGVECEPYISCDDVLMRERAPEILSGAQVLMHALADRRMLRRRRERQA